MPNLLIVAPVQAIALALFLMFSAVAVGARWIIRARLTEEGGKQLADEAVHLLTGLAATFAFFVGFAINVTWSAVSAGQAAVEQHAAAIKQMSWTIGSMNDKVEAARLLDKLRSYTLSIVNDDREELARGDTASLPSDAMLNEFGDAVHDYAFRQAGVGPESTSLLRDSASVGGTSAAVAAVAERNPPRILLALLLISGGIVAGVMGITAVTSRFPALMFVWCLIPALSITVVIALIFPFARPIGVDLVPLNSVAQQLHPR
jgi:hypothetical protein